MSELAQKITEEFSNKNYAYGYMESHVDAAIAAQIKTLREQRGLTQAQLAELAGMKQERVCALEDVDYSAWTVKTLRKLAKAFDVHLQVRFAPFSKGILDVVNLSKESLKVTPRDEDLKEFAKQSLGNSDGEWKPINAAPRITLSLKTINGPASPTKNWWQLNELQSDKIAA